MALRWRRLVLGGLLWAAAVAPVQAEGSSKPLSLAFEWVSGAFAGQQFERAAMMVPIGSGRRVLQLDTGAGASLVYSGAVPALERAGVLRRTDNPEWLELSLVLAEGRHWVVPVMVYPREVDGDGTVGMLGMLALRDAALVIDYPAQQLHLLKGEHAAALAAPPPGGEWSPLMTVPSQLQVGVEARIDGVPIGPMLLDTGASPFGLARWPQPDDPLPVEMDAEAKVTSLGAHQTMEGAITLTPLKGQHQVCLLGRCIDHETLLSSRTIIPGLRGIVGNRYFWNGVLVLDYAHQRALYSDDAALVRRWLNLN